MKLSACEHGKPVCENCDRCEDAGTITRLESRIAMLRAGLAWVSTLRCTLMDDSRLCASCKAIDLLKADDKAGA